MDKAMIDVKVGETVKVVEYDGRRQNGQNAKDATVIKVARVWITVKVGTWREIKLRRDNQTDGSGYGYATCFYTSAQWEERARRTEAMAFLREQGITVEHKSPWKDREVDLAAMLKLYVHSEKAVAEEEADRGTSG